MGHQGIVWTSLTFCLSSFLSFFLDICEQLWILCRRVFVFFSNSQCFDWWASCTGCRQWSTCPKARTTNCGKVRTGVTCLQHRRKRKANDAALASEVSARGADSRAFLILPGSPDLALLWWKLWEQRLRGRKVCQCVLQAFIGWDDDAAEDGALVSRERTGCTQSLARSDVSLCSSRASRGAWWEAYRWGQE